MHHLINVDLPTRLDRYLRRLYPQLTQGMIEKHLRLGEIKLNDSKTEANVRVNSGDRLSINSSLDAGGIVKEYLNFSNAAIQLAKKLQSEYLIFDCEHFFAINKPAKLATQGGSKINLSINDAINYLNSINNCQFKLVHRLDKETSGILLIAKTYYSANKLAVAFKEKVIIKNYIAQLFGTPLKQSGEVRNMLLKSRLGSFEHVQECNNTGKLAITKYKVLNATGNISTIEFTPLTGRMHQLRVHAKMLGCPIIGDEKYNSLASSPKSIYMMLHAHTMQLPKEIFGSNIIISAALPNYFNTI